MTDTNQGTTKIEKERSTPYPGLTLSDAIIATEQLRKAYGAGSAYSRETVAEALGHQSLSGPATKKIAALTHFGLLRRDATVYRQSEVADRIFNFLTEEEKRQAILEAFQSPALYQRLVNDFNDKALPTSLDKVLIRNYNITESSAKTAAKIFTESAIFAGVLQNGILSTSGIQSSAAPNTVPDDNDGDNPAPAPQTQPEPHQQPAPSNDLTIEVPGTGIVVTFPQEYSFDLSIGAFAASIKQLRDDASALDIGTDGGNADTNEDME